MTEHPQNPIQLLPTPQRPSLSPSPSPKTSSKPSERYRLLTASSPRFPQKIPRSDPNPRKPQGSRNPLMRLLPPLPQTRSNLSCCEFHLTIWPLYNLDELCVIDLLTHGLYFSFLLHFTSVLFQSSYLFVGLNITIMKVNLALMYSDWSRTVN